MGKEREEEGQIEEEVREGGKGAERVPFNLPSLECSLRKGARSSKSSSLQIDVCGTK